MTTKIINNHIVLQDDNRLRTFFPEIKEATIRGQRFMAVPHTLDAARILNNIGIPVQSPIRTQYDWPGRFTPRWYQIDTAEFFTLNNRNHCHNAPRTGKTLASLWAADYLKKEGKIKRVLIVAPLSTLWDVWGQNIFEHFPLTNYAILHGSRKYREKMLDQKHDYYVINHHGVKLMEKQLAKRKDIDLVIVDEVATFRSAKNRRTKTKKGGVLWEPLNHVLNKQGVPRSAWGLTGTPTPNEPTDAFGQCKLITPENYSGYFTTFKHETMFQVSQFKWVPKKTAAQSVSRILKPSIRFERNVCTDMEPCFIDRRAQLSAQQDKAYKQLIQLAMTEIEGSTVTAVNAAILLSKIIQTATGAVLDATGKVVRMDFGPRLKVLEELIEENREKVLVFVPFKGAQYALAEELNKKWTTEVVNGDVSVKKRNDIFHRFRATKDPHILVCHPKVMAHGLDLSTASLSIWYAPHWKAEEYQQANARTDGSGQKVKIDIAHIHATTEERRVYDVLRGKGRFQDVVLGLSKKEG